MRISDWSSDVCSSDLGSQHLGGQRMVALQLLLLELCVRLAEKAATLAAQSVGIGLAQRLVAVEADRLGEAGHRRRLHARPPRLLAHGQQRDFARVVRSEEHTSELQSLMRISYAVFCLK